MIRRLALPVALVLALLAPATTAGAVTAYRNVGSRGSQVSIKNWGTSATAPPRGRGATCVTANKGDISRIFSRVVYLENGVQRSLTGIAVDKPAVGQCAISDDYEWAYPGRYFLKSVHTATVNGVLYSWVCYLYSCT